MNRRNFLKTLPTIAVLAGTGSGLGGLLDSYYIEPYRLEVTNVGITTNKLKNAHLKIVQISDLHCDKKVRNETKLVSLINGIKPDIIVFTGDALNAEAGLSMLKETLKNLQAPLGKFAVRGNYDFECLPQLDRFSDTGFAVLDADTVCLSKDGDSFYITGLSFGMMSYWPKTLRKIPADGYSTFLFHMPDLVDYLEGCNVDLYMAGHTHGGQVALPFLGAIYRRHTRFGKNYEAGKYQVGSITMYVNRGIGMAGRFPPVRFCCRPEITVFDIYPSTNPSISKPA